MSISKAVLRIRREMGMTQGEVGERAGLAASYVSRIENGHIQPTMTTLSRLAAALGVPASDIFRVSEEDGGPRTARCPVSTSGECIGELLRGNQGQWPSGSKTHYGKEELRLLRIANFLVVHGSKDVRSTLTVVLDSLLTHAKNSNGKSSNGKSSLSASADRA